MGEDRRVKGSFVGHDDDGGVAVRLEMRTSDRRSVVDVAPMVGPGGRSIVSDDRKVAHHLHRISLALAAETYARRRIAPIEKPAPTKRRKSEPPARLCPGCLGQRSYDCDVCEGAGQVPG